MPDFTLYPLSVSPRVPFKFDGRILYTSPHYEMVHLTLQPGETMDPHVQPFDIVFFVVEGAAFLRVGEEDFEVPENTAVHVDKGVARAWRNDSNNPVRILVNKLL